ncbi:MAG: hypothetical protein IT380_25710 [Myxococcales bacterium]|nr:hypothetical protein [Myxococcales bacterium]
MTRAAVVVALGLGLVARADKTWTLDDLKALDASRSYAELVEHAEDLPPKSRADEWKALVARAAAAVVSSTEDSPKQPFAGADRGVALSKRFQFLSADAGFQAAVEVSALSSMKKCAPTGADCLALVMPAVPLHRPASLVELGKALRAGRRPTAPMTLFARAIGSTVDHPACREAAVQEATVASLEFKPDEELASAARKVAFDACWKAMEKPLKAALVHASDALRRNACAPMRAKKALTELQDELCKEVE